MKTTFIYLSLPLAMACSKHQSKSGTTKTSELTQPEPTRIIGVVNYDEKCRIDKKEVACLKIKGGDDLNDSRTFVLNDKVNGFEVLDEKSKPKTFRIWTKTKEKPIEVFENEHVSIVAEMEKASNSESPRIGTLESVAQLEK